DAAPAGGRVLRVDADGSIRQIVGPEWVIRPEWMIVTPVCGNGIIEPGEACDGTQGCSEICL
ncbi:MAG TPA: hypothetical protein VEB21_10935, partial [Terriglobales bacterium]|nr:hypothetical protein [Terriglobales bacterium]